MSKRIIIIFLEIMTYAVLNAQSYNFSVKETSGGVYTININISTQHISVSQNTRNIFKYKYYSATSDEKGFVGFSFKPNSSPLLRPKRPGHFFIVGSNGIFCNTADDKKAFVFKPISQSDFDVKYTQLSKILKNKNNIFYVSTSKEFIKALGSDRTIIIADDAELNLYEALSDETFTESLNVQINPDITNLDLSNSIAIQNSWLQSGLYCLGINNLTIKGSPQKPAKLLTEDGEAEVINFYKCNEIHLENIIMGHIKGIGCYGDVLYFEDCNNMLMNNCSLFGCGIIGIRMNKTSNFSCFNSRIYECSHYIMSIMDECNNVLFEKCAFYDNGGGISTGKNSKGIIFNNCSFKKNDKSFFDGESKINLKGCVIKHDSKSIGKKEFLITDSKTVFQNND